MTPDKWQQVKKTFQKASELPRDKQAQYVKTACGDDPETFAMVMDMLSAITEKPHFLENPLQNFQMLIGDDEGPEKMVGSVIGAYRIERMIGEGGMGVVYLAERDDEEFQKKVAIKILKRGMDTDALLQRFRVERQTLAGLNHPYIARMLDGGSTEDGRPFFIMEYVEGIPIDKYCDEKRLTVDERLRLFLKVCEAVQYAHQNLVVHRDLKPANILVTSGGTPKLLDFGIAKLLQPESSHQTAESTVAGMRFLTPEFASPEQIRGEMITTASDVYSLGALLYLLLTGCRPYYFQRRSLTEIEKVISETIPANPSHLVSRLNHSVLSVGEELPDIEEVCRSRNATREKISKRLSGDLDNIVKMALRKEPELRYQSVGQFGEDIRRHFAGLPVLARKDTFRYRTGKFIRRHRGALLSVSLVILILILSVISIAWKERQVSREAAKARQIVTYLKEMLAASDPYDAEQQMTIVELLDKADENIANELKNQPEIEAEVRSILGNSYMNSGIFEKALAQYQQALNINRKLFGEHSLPVADNLHDIGMVKHYQGKFTEADSFYMKSIELYETLGDAPTRRYAESLNDHGLLLLDISQMDEAVDWLQRSLSMFRQLGDQDNIAIGLNNLGYAYDLMGEYENAEKIYRESLALNKKIYGEENIAVARNLNNLAAVLLSKGDTVEAVQMLDQSLAIRRQILGDEHPDVALAIHNLAHFLNIQGDYQQAEKLEREALYRWEKALPPDHPYIALSNLLLGRILINRGKLKEAEPFLRKSLALRLKKFGAEHLSVAETQAILGYWLLLMHRYSEAEKMLLTAKAFLENQKNQNSVYLKTVLQSLAKLEQIRNEPLRAIE